MSLIWSVTSRKNAQTIMLHWLTKSAQGVLMLTYQWVVALSSLRAQRQQHLYAKARWPLSTMSPLSSRALVRWDIWKNNYHFANSREKIVDLQCSLRKQAWQKTWCQSDKTFEKVDDNFRASPKSLACIHQLFKPEQIQRKSLKPTRVVLSTWVSSLNRMRKK